jgi:tetratricopeptide (TPR) repeat protein
MRRSLFLAIPFILLVAPVGRAQESAAAPATTEPPVENISQLTPREAAELRADILMARKEFEGAIRAYDAILKNDPKNATLLNKMGVAYQQMTDLRHSERCYKKAMQADKTFASAVNNVGTVEYERGHNGKAISYYRKALVFGSEMPTIYSNLGYAYFSNKEYPEAMGSFAKALALDPSVFDRKGGNGTIIQDRTAPDPGLFNYFVAKSFAQAGDAERAAHYLKLSRDDGYKGYTAALTDPAFARVIKDPGVQDVFRVIPAYAVEGKKPTSN